MGLVEMCKIVCGVFIDGGFDFIVGSGEKTQK